jgi:hypothetical protein
MTTETRRTEITRRDYMAGLITHTAYYGAIVEVIGETALRALLPGTRTPDDWRALVAANEHLNNVPLASWDKQHDTVVRLIQPVKPKLKAITGPGGWSLSDSVCTLKETARRYAEGGEASDAPITLSQFIQGAADIGRPFKFTASRISSRPDGITDWGVGARHWRITITRDGRQMRVYFSQGSAHTAPPTLDDVLDCLASDAAGIENARGFDDWCSEYG